MTQTDPPRFATWMLDHFVPGGRDEALAGDLLEEFRSGRSSAWYWSQTLSACGLGWLNNIHQNRYLVLFAALWSMLAPAWTMLIDRLENKASFFGQIWRMSFPLSSVTEFAIWASCNLIFLWTGMLLYLMPHAIHRRALNKRQLRRAILVPLVMFNVVYVGVFVLMNLYSYPGLVIDRRTMTAVGEIIDVRQWAMVLRLPYFVTMLCALWQTRGYVADTLRPAVELAQNGSSIPSAASPPLEIGAEARSIRGPIALFAGAGLLNSLIVAILLCRLPESHFPSVAAVLVRAGVYVSLGALAGVAGAWFYWKRSSAVYRLLPAVSFRLFALICAASWIWVPAAVLLQQQDSPAAAGIAALGAVILAIGLRKTIPAPAGSASSSFPLDGAFDSFASQELFAATLAVPERRFQGYVVAVCIYTAAWSLRDRSTATASALLAVAAFVFAWEFILPPARRFAYWENRRAALRLVRIAVPAILVTAWALLDGVAHRNQLAAGAGIAGDNDRTKHVANVPTPASALAGYESIILWPYLEKKQIVPPVRVRSPLFGPGTWHPLVIRFDGPYLYFQPGHRPESDGHQAHGSPLSVKIESANSRPLIIEAHQTLSTPIPLARCREIDVEIRNRDNEPGAIALAVLLKDSSAPRKSSSLYLGQRPIESTQPDRFAVKTSPVYETLRFEVPTHADIRKFDEITVMVLPDPERSFVGPKIAIEQFQIDPR